MESPAHSILMIDDDIQDQDLVRVFLSKAPRTRYELACAGTYDAAYALLRSSRHHIDAILLNPCLTCEGKQNLFDLLDERGFPVIFLTPIGENVDPLPVAMDSLPKSKMNIEILDLLLRYAMERKRTR